jgi:acetyl-CoA carboxylase carboxyl transferase subunit beta
MANGWFRRRKAAADDSLPEGLWTQCPKCKELLFTREWERNLKVCLKCNYHFRLTARERLDLLLDDGSFVERDAELLSVNVLDFPGYSDSLQRYRTATGQADAVLSGEGLLEGYPLTIAVTDSHFMMGSMGSVVGERIARAVEHATERGIATLLVSGTGGGARMQEGLLSLMQMAKTSAALARHQDAGLLALVLLTEPTMGGVTASWGSLGDVILAEPGAMIGFAGLRVSQQAQVHKVPADFQTAEFQLAHGQVDRIVPRKELKETLAKLLAFSGAQAEAIPPETVTHVG